jgi:hypothetical protein
LIQNKQNKKIKVPDEKIRPACTNVSNVWILGVGIRTLPTTILIL